MGVKNFDFAVFQENVFGPGETDEPRVPDGVLQHLQSPAVCRPNTTQVSPNFGHVTSTLGNRGSFSLG